MSLQFLSPSNLPLKSATLIYNPIAGRHRARRERQVEEAAAALKSAGIDAELARTSDPGTAREIAQAAVKKGNELMLVCGGDGTINEVLNGIVPGDIPLGILPAGTANIVARELGLPQNPVRAAIALPKWSPRRIAVGLATWPALGRSGAPGAGRAAMPEGGHSAPVAPAAESAQRPPVPGCEAPPRSTVEQRYFLSVAGIGFDAYVVSKLSSDFKMSLGVVAYCMEAVRQGLRYSFPLFTCQVDGRQFHAPFAVVQRTRRYAGWLQLAPGADIFEPRFHLCLFKSRLWARYLLYAAAVITRQHLRLGDVELVEATKVVCPAPEYDGPIYVELDGELAAQLPATFEILPDALTLLAP